MKYHSIFTPALTSLCLLTTTASFASESSTLPVEDPARWFEIEIILFKHISTQERNEEQFSAQNLSAKKRNALDLLTPYLQPNITSLKQLLPSCGQPNVSFPYNIEPTPFNVETSESDDNIVNDSEQSDKTALTDREEENANTSVMHVKALSSTENIDDIELGTIAQTTTSDERPTQSQYADITLPHYNQYPSDSRAPLCVIPADFFEKHLNSEQLAQFSIDGFPIKKLTTTIDGIEQWRADENGQIIWASKKPYLISKESLRLKSIANSIKRSRNYAPLLHLGWRQIGESRRQAKAIKLYAGQNLKLDYQHAIAEQATQQTALAIKTILDKRQQAAALILSQQQLDKDIANGDVNGTQVLPEETLASGLGFIDEIDTTAMPVKELTIEEELRQQAKQQQLDKLFQQFALLNESEVTTKALTEDKASKNDFTKAIVHTTLIDEAEVKHIVAQLSADITKPVKPLFDQVAEGTTPEKPVTIEAPLQPWSLDGLFKVHLDHYLYLNSEFNIIEPLANIANTKNTKQANKSQTEQQVISFKQDRRVVTGEIHYFDHPHMGMVVQIRRFDPTKPADEAVTQAKK